MTLERPAASAVALPSLSVAEKPAPTLAVASRAASSVRVQVGTLALPGLSRAEGVRLSTAFQGELTRLLAVRELHSQTREAERVLVPHFVIRVNEPVELTGRRLARLVVERLNF
jgi:hypothetical protein